VVALTTAATVLVGGGAAAALGASSDADLLSDDFSQGMGQWSTSGGDWQVDQDGRLRQNQVGPDNARATAGSTQWTDYAAQSRVQPTEFGADGAFAGISVRATEATIFARLVLVAAGRAEVQVVRGGQVSVVASGPAVVTPGVWHTLRLEGRGESLKGYVDGNPVSPTGPGGTVGLSPTGQIGLQTAQAAATFDDIRVTGLNGTDSGSTPAPDVTTGPAPTTRRSPQRGRPS
jgi:hypothetical protein